MNHRLIHLLPALLVALAFCTPAVRANDDMPNIRIQVSNKSFGSTSRGNSRTSQRELKITIDNRETEAFDNVTMEWTVVARDINNRKLSIAGSGKKTVDIPADTDTEVSSGVFSFSKQEGKIERTKGKNNNKNNNKKNKRVKVSPDTGTRYAGYVVTFKKGGKIIAEASTAGMKDRIKGLGPAKKPSGKKKK